MLVFALVFVVDAVVPLRFKGHQQERNFDGPVGVATRPAASPGFFPASYTLVLSQGWVQIARFVGFVARPFGFWAASEAALSGAVLGLDRGAERSENHAARAMTFCAAVRLGGPFQYGEKAKQRAREREREAQISCPRAQGHQRKPSKVPERH